MFYLIPIGVAVGIVAHHWVIHPELKGRARLLQWGDINNHETLIMFFIGMGIGMMI